MTDPQPLPGRNKPQRAEPIQPDVPGSGDDTAHAADPAAPDTKDAAAKSKAQSATALDNVRKGYD